MFIRRDPNDYTSAELQPKPAQPTPPPEQPTEQPKQGKKQ